MELVGLWGKSSDKGSDLADSKGLMALHAD